MLFKLDVKSNQKNFLDRKGTALVKFFKDGSVKSLTGAVGPGMPDHGQAVVDSPGGECPLE